MRRSTCLHERLKDRYHGERFDNLDDAFLERVRAGYLWEAKQRNLPVVFATEDARHGGRQYLEASFRTASRTRHQPSSRRDATGFCQRNYRAKRR